MEGDVITMNDVVSFEFGHEDASGKIVGHYRTALARPLFETRPTSFGLEKAWMEAAEPVTCGSADRRRDQLLLVGSASAVLLVWDVNVSRLRGRFGMVHSRRRGSGPDAPVQGLLSEPLISPASCRTTHAPATAQPGYPSAERHRLEARDRYRLRRGPEGFFYGRSSCWPLAALSMPVEVFLVARAIFGWERARFQKVVLEQLPDVMALICRAVGAGIPLSEARRSVVKDAPTPSHEAFVDVVSGLAIGQRLEDALWNLYERVGLPIRLLCGHDQPAGANRR